MKRRKRGGSKTRYLSVVFEPVGRRTKIQPGTTILEAAKKAGVTISSDCGGQGFCGRCKVIISDRDACGTQTSAESRFLSDVEVEAGYRLACQAIVEDDLAVMIPEESRREERKFQVHGLERAIHVDPDMRKIHLTLSEPSLKDRRTIAEKLLEGAEEAKIEGMEIDLWALRQLTEALRSPGLGVTLTILDEGRVISIEEGDTTGRLFSAALDLGTSKVVGHLVDLTNGRTMAVASIENPQTIYGEDVMSRITFALKGGGNVEELRRLLLEAVNQVLRRLCSEAEVKPHEVYESVAVGNTVMHHLFLGLDPGSLARSPFTPLVRSGISVAARELSVDIHPAGVVSLPPLVDGFVGSDAVADLIASGIHESGEQALLIDVGTNTEVFAGDRRGLVCCSCASGPAFEGGHISHGVKAVSGAIERLHIDPKTFEVGYETINGRKPIGLCGSAMIDALAEMWKYGLIDGLGRFNPEAGTSRMRASADGGEFVVEWSDSTETGQDITIIQGDIEELMLAKAAIYAACSIMLRHRGLKAEDLARVYMAGAFGSYIDPENAVVIGMLPDLPAEKIVFVGNTAVTGAKMMLLSKEVRREAETLSDKVQYHELSLDPEFNREFIDALFIPHKKPARFPSVQGIALSRGQKPSTRS